MLGLGLRQSRSEKRKVQNMNIALPNINSFLTEGGFPELRAGRAAILSSVSIPGQQWE